MAKFRFRNYKIIETVFKYNPDKKIGDELSIEFSRHGSTENNLFSLRLTVEIFDNNKNLKIVVDTISFFEYDSDLDEKAKNAFFTQNGPAILFPYIRAYITSITSLAGLSPIYLPTINFAQSGVKNNDEAGK